MKTKPISKNLFSARPFFILGFLILAYSCNLKSEPPLFVPAPKSPFAVGENPNDITLGDVNGDSKLDIVTVNPGSRNISVLLGDGTGNFTPVQNSMFLDSTSHILVIGDVNNDKKPDVLISCHDSYGVTVLLGNGQGNFSSAPGSPFSVLDSTRPHNHGLAVGDINKDGNLDFATSNYGHHSVSVMLGNGKGGFAPAPASPFKVGRGPYPLVLGDVNEDGNLDIITPNVSSNNVSVLLGDGKGDFSSAPHSPFSVETRPYFATSGDLNGDGNLDIITSHDDITKISFLLGDGKGGFRTAPSSPLDIGKRGWKAEVADMNQDSLTDLVMCNTGVDYVTVMVGDGKGNFKHAPGSPYKVGNGPTGITVGDLNGDGKNDIVAANARGNNVTVLLAR